VFLGNGQFSRVHLIQSDSSDNSLALKTIIISGNYYCGTTNGKKKILDIKQELERIHSLRHENIVTIQEVNTENLSKSSISMYDNKSIFSDSPMSFTTKQFNSYGHWVITIKME